MKRFFTLLLFTLLMGVTAFSQVTISQDVCLAEGMFYL
nr:MAG TPA: Somatic embryogenesis receptor kinase 1 rich repeat receptor, membrane [Bacteriophage sp.]